jgi:hypothetical protein
VLRKKGLRRVSMYEEFYKKDIDKKVNEGQSNIEMDREALAAPVAPAADKNSFRRSLKAAKYEDLVALRDAQISPVPISSPFGADDFGS